MYKKKNLKPWLIKYLRKISLYWPARTEAKSKARVKRGLYECAQCKGHFHSKEIDLDHIKPVVKLDGFTTWDDYINRLFCESDNFQVLCKKCHEIKGLVEDKTREKLKKLKK